MFRFDPFSPEIDADPFPAYETLRNEYPCYWSTDAKLWVLSRYSDISKALNNWQTFSSAKGNLMSELPGRAGSTLGTTDPPRHDRLRALVQHAFTRRHLETMGEPMREIARNILNGLRDQKEFDFIDAFTARYTVNVLFATLGLPPGDEKKVRDMAVLMVQTDPVTRGKTAVHLDAAQWMREYTANVIAERRRNPQDDLISHFSMAEIDGDRLSEDEVLLTTMTLIMAGVESLGGFMAMFGLNMADYPDARRAIIANPALLADAIEESLRYNTSAQRFRRVVTKDTELHGQIMREGDFLCLAYGSGNRDERQFPRADVYDISRKPRGHLGFGGGVHNCLGAAIARMATVIAMEEFHQLFPDYTRAEDVLPWIPSSNFRSPTRLVLSVH